MEKLKSSKMMSLHWQEIFISNIAPVTVQLLFFVLKSAYYAPAIKIGNATIILITLEVPCDLPLPCPLAC